MAKLIIWVSGNSKEASRRYRVDCYLSQYREFYDIIYFDNVSLKKSIYSVGLFYYLYLIIIAKAIFLQRRLLPISVVKILKFFKKKIIFDIDDGIQVYKQYEKFDFETFGKLINTFIVGNDNLYKYWSNYTNNIVKIETGVKYLNYKFRNFNSEYIEFLWIGTSSNFGNLRIFVDVFLNSKFNNLKLKIISDKIPPYINLDKDSIDFEYWSEETDNIIASSTKAYIGVMPLQLSDPQSRFKCSFKMLQYMNWSMPVIVTGCGMNNDLLNIDNIGFALTNVFEFDKHIELLKKNNNLYDIMAKNGNRLILNNFNSNIIFNKYKNIIENELSNL